MTLDTIASFGWNFAKEFFLETKEGNFVWSDPDYGGDNTIRKFNGSLVDYCKQAGIPYIRDKGHHTVRNYCGKDVKFDLSIAKAEE